MQVLVLLWENVGLLWWHSWENFLSSAVSIYWGTPMGLVKTQWKWVWRPHPVYGDLANKILEVIYQLHDTCKDADRTTIYAVVRKVLRTLRDVANDGIDFDELEREVLEALEFDMSYDRDLCREIAKARARSQVRGYRRYHPRHW